MAVPSSLAIRTIVVSTRVAVRSQAADTDVVVHRGLDLLDRLEADLAGSGRRLNGELVAARRELRALL